MPNLGGLPTCQSWARSGVTAARGADAAPSLSARFVYFAKFSLLASARRPTDHARGGELGPSTSKARGREREGRSAAATPARSAVAALGRGGTTPAHVITFFLSGRRTVSARCHVKPLDVSGRYHFDNPRDRITSRSPRPRHEVLAAVVGGATMAS